MSKNTKNTAHTEHMKAVAVEVVNHIMQYTADTQFSERQLAKKKFQSIPGMRHEKLKLSEKFVRAEFQVQKKEALSGYSKERTTALLAQAVSALDSAKKGTNNVGVGVGRGLRAMCSPFINIKHGWDSQAATE